MALFGGTSNSETITGTSGDDVILGQGGRDTLIGGDGNDELQSGEYITTQGASADHIGDRLDGGNGNDTLIGGSGNDTLIGGAGSNDLRGGAGYDTAVFSGVRADYTVAMSNGLPVAVRATGGNDSLSSVERLSFADGAIAFDVDGDAGMVYRLYKAAFDRTPDDIGLGYWIDAADRNVSAMDIAIGFADSPEFRDLYGANLTTEQFITTLYDNVLDRHYDQGGFDYWMDVMTNNGVSRAEVLLFFAQSPENRAAVIGEIQNGIEYTPFG